MLTRLKLPSNLLSWTRPSPDSGLAIGRSREDLRLLGRDSSVMAYKLGRNSAERFNSWISTVEWDYKFKKSFQHVLRDKGVTSRSKISVTFPARTLPWLVTPIATALSGLTPLLGSRTHGQRWFWQCRKHMAYETYHQPRWLRWSRWASHQHQRELFCNVRQYAE